MRQWWLGLIVGAAIGGAAGAGVAMLVQPRATVAAPDEQGRQTRQYIHELAVDRLLLVDTTTQIRGEWTVGDLGAALRLFDPAGNTRVGMFASGDTSRLVLRDPHVPSPDRTIAVVVSDNSLSLGMRDGQASLASIVQQDGQALIALWDGTGRPVWASPP